MKSTGEAIRFIPNLKDKFFREIYSERNLYLSKIMISRSGFGQCYKDYF